MKHPSGSILLTLASGLMLWFPVRVLALSREDSSRPNDSIRIISEVTVNSDMRYHETILPQLLKGEALQRLNAHSVADAIRHFSGVQLKDYGGLGGIKTINIRSMGSQHVGIYYDGIELGNAQNGQIDLGQLSLDNIDEISIYNGQRSAIMQTASDFANAGSVYIRTKAPTADHFRFKLQSGSSNLARLSALCERRLNNGLGISVNAEGLSSNGKYDFHYRRLNYDGTVAYDTTAIRQNGDIQAIRAEVNIFGTNDATAEHESTWSAKAYTYHSSRGIPGAIVNNVWRRGERQSDGNTMLQAQWQREISDRYTARIAAKYAYYATHYQNRDTTQLMVDNRFRQQEFYLTTTHVLSLTSHWSTSACYDLRWNHLSSDVAHFAHPTRITQLASVATAFDTHHWQAQASTVFTLVNDKVRNDRPQSDVHHLTPALFVSYTPLHNRKQLQFKAFAKKSFRMPTFNDLYYTDMGNALLRPEKALQFNIGLTSEMQISPISSINWSADLYHNSIHDKIVAYPKGQQFRWTMLNLGLVHINGIDLQATAEIHPLSNLQYGIMMQYTYQDARDVTDPSTSFYQDQIPYIPWHSGSTTLWMQWNDLHLSYNFIYTGERYCQQENILYNHLQPWYTSDLGISYWLSSKQTDSKDIKLTLEVNNLFDQQYDVIINYPMPGRHYVISLVWEL